MVPFQQQELLVGSDASLWLWGMEDGELSHVEPLMLVYGRFHIGQEAEKVLSAANGAMKYGFSDPGEFAQCSIADSIKIDAEFTTELSTIGQFYTFLAQHDHVNVPVECHNAQLVFQKDHQEVATSSQLEISAKQTAAFMPQAIPQGHVEDWQNAGSRLLCPGAAGAGRSKSWAVSGEHKSGWVRLHHHIRYDQAKTNMVIRPTKPGVYLTRPVTIRQNELVRLA